MKTIFWGFLLLIMLVIPINNVFAYPPCGPYRYPDESICRPKDIPYQLVRVRPELHFAWIRSEPSMYAPTLIMVYPSTGATMITLANENLNASISWDGYQWWWEVELYPAGGVRGWVEMASLTEITDPSIQILADWVQPLSGEIEAGMSFAWIRETPSSDGKIVYTLQQGQEFELLGRTNFDGYQWWWAIRLMESKGTVTGWLEQGSITPISD